VFGWLSDCVAGRPRLFIPAELIKQATDYVTILLDSLSWSDALSVLRLAPTLPVDASRIDWSAGSSAMNRALCWLLVCQRKCLAIDSRVVLDGKRSSVVDALTGRALVYSNLPQIRTRGVGTQATNILKGGAASITRPHSYSSRGGRRETGERKV